MIVVNIEPCIVIVCNTIFKYAVWAGALDLDFVLSDFVMILSGVHH